MRRDAAGGSRDAAEGAVLLTAPRIRRLFVTILVLLGVLVALDSLFNVLLVVRRLGIRRIFNVAREESLPTWFVSSLALLAGLTFLAVHRAVRTREKVASRAGWLVLAGFFVYLSLDDAAGVHERVGSALGEALLPGNLPTYAWQILLGPLFVLAGAFAGVFLWRQYGRFGRRRYVVLGLLCFALAMGLDAAEGVEGAVAAIAARVGAPPPLAGHYLRVLEESLEVLGTALFWVGGLYHLMHEADGRRVTLAQAPLRPGA